MADADKDFDTNAPITEMTYEQWKEGLSTNPNYHDEFYMPQHFRVQFKQKHTCQTLTKIREEHKFDEISNSTNSHEC